MHTTLRRLVTNDVVRHGFLVLVATMLGNIASFGYHAVASRRLGVADYGTLYALISFASLVTMPLAFFPTVIARYAAEFHSLGDDAHMKSLIQFVATCSAAALAVLALILCLAAVPLSRFMNVSAWLILPTSLLAAIGTMSPMLRSILQGEGQFGHFSLASAAEGMGKLVFGAASAIAGLGVFGGLLGFCAGGVCGIFYAACSLWFRYRGKHRAPFLVDWKRVLQTSGGAAAISAAVAILTTSDVILVKHYFQSADAGLYSAASLGGKILLFAASFAPTIVLPKATRGHTRGERTRQTLVGAGAMLAVISILGLIIFNYGGAIVLRGLVGNQFSRAIPMLVSYGFAMSLLAGTTLICSYSLALHRLTFTVPLVASALLEPVGIALFHRDLLTVIQVVVSANALVFIAVCLSLYADSLRIRDAKAA